MDEAIKSNDEERIKELKQSLLEVESKPGDRHSAKSSPGSSPTMNPSSFHSDMSLQTKSLFSQEEEIYLEKAIKQNTKQYDFQVNIMIVGNSNTGKTSLINAMMGKVGRHTEPTIG